MVEKLSKNILFSNIPLHELIELLDTISYTSLTYEKGDTILSQGDSYEELYLLVDGTCHSRVLDYRGRELKIEEFKPGTVFAPAVLFASDNAMPGSVIAETDLEAAVFSRDAVLGLCTNNPVFLQNFLSLLSNKFRFISGKLTAMSFRTIREKLAYYLLGLNPGPDGSLVLTMTLEDLASYFGVSRPSLSRVFGRLEAEGVLKKSNRKIEILNIDVLLADAPDE